MARADFTDIPLLPDPSSDTFPPAIARMITCVAAETETPEGLGASMALGALATACQGKIVLRVKPGYVEPLNIWTIAPLDSGNRKTGVQRRMTKPLTDWELEQAESLRKDTIRANADRDTLIAKIASMRTKAAKLDGVDFERSKREIADLEIDLPEIARLPRSWVQDITPEKLGSLMAEHGERMALISDEGGIFETLAGRYSHGIPNLDLFLQSHAGAPHRVDRGNRPPVLMKAPALTLVLSPQLEVLHGLALNKDFKGRGLLARFLYILSTSRLGSRTGISPVTPEGVSADYDQRIKALLNLKPPTAEPFVIEVSTEARNEWLDFFLIVEAGMREDGRFENLRDWAGKLPGLAARIAGLLHCADHTLDGQLRTELSCDIMKRALGLAAVCARHALAAFDLMGANAELKTARKLWGWIARQRKPVFSFRDAFRGLRGTCPRAADLEPGFEVLLERSCLRERPVDPKVGRPTRIFQVNPALTRDWIEEGEA